MIKFIVFVVSMFVLPSTILAETPIPIIYAKPKVTYRYRLGFMREKTRFYSVVVYEDKTRKVPIINGYVPEITEFLFKNGDKHIVYDYRKRILFSKVKVNFGRLPN